MNALLKGSSASLPRMNALLRCLTGRLGDSLEDLPPVFSPTSMSEVAVR